MEIKDIEKLARLMQETGLTALEYAQGEAQLKVERKQEITVAAAAAAPVSAAPSLGGAEALGVTHAQDSQPAKEGALVLSPMVGVFYSSPNPEARPYVQVGDTVKKGDTLCIIEAMKLMNEIPAEVDGTVAEICVSNGQVVEFNQPLFRIV